MGRKFVFRLDQEGVEDLRRNLERLGKDGQKAFQNITNASPQLINPMTRAERSVDGVRRQLERLGRQGGGYIRGLGTELAGTARSFLGLNAIIGSLAGTAGIGLLARNALRSADDLQDLSTQLGINVERLQELQFGAAQTGVGIDKLNTGLTFFERKLADAAAGGKEAATFFKDLKIPILEDGHIRLDALDAFADKVKEIRDPVERLRVVTEAFGARNPAFVNFLKDGSAGLAEMGRQARALGAVMDADLVRKGADANDQLDALGALIRTNFNVGLISGFVGEFHNFTDAAKDPEFQKSLRDTGRGVGELVKLVVANAPAVVDFFKEIADYINRSAQEAQDLYNWINRVIDSAATGLGDVDRFIKRNTGIDFQGSPLGPFGPPSAGNTIGAAAGAAFALPTPPSGAPAPTSSGNFQFAQPKPDSGSIDKETRARENALLAIEALIQGYRDEAAILSVSQGEREGLSAVLRAEEIIRQANTKLTKDQIVLDEKKKEQILEIVSALQQQRANERIEETLRGIREEAMLTGLSAKEHEKLSIILGVENELRREGKTLQAGQRAELEAEITNLQRLREASDRMDELRQSGLDAGRALSDGLRSAALDGENLLDVLDRLEDRLLNIAYDVLIDQPFANFLKQGMSGGAVGSSGGGGLGGIFDFLGSIFGLGGGPSLGGAGSVGTPGIIGTIPGIYHEGGIVGRSSVPRRLDRAALYGNAPRLHDGLAPGEFRAILKRDEAVIPLRNGRVPVEIMGGDRPRDGGTVNNFYLGGNGRDGFRRTAAQEARDLTNMARRLTAR